MMDAEIESEGDVDSSAVEAGWVLRKMEDAQNPVNIVILDACRDNPFGGDLKSGKGLSQMDAPIGTLLAYATAPGKVASDGEGVNGLYTAELLKAMEIPGAKVEEVFKVMRLCHGVTELLQQGLEVLFRRLLAVKARGVSFGPCQCGQTSCRLDVLFRLENPLRGVTLHTRPCPFPSLRGETSRNRLRAALARSAWACGQ